MIFRLLIPEDFPQIKEVFLHAINQIADKKYSKEQIMAWSQSINDENRWVNMIQEEHWIGAFDDLNLLGFIGFREPNYVNMLYVSPTVSRSGIATKLFNELFRTIDLTNQSLIETHASEIARPFFEKQGFKVIKKNWVSRNGVQLHNYLMRLSLATNSFIV